MREYFRKHRSEAYILLAAAALIVIIAAFTAARCSEEASETEEETIASIHSLTEDELYEMEK